MSCLRALGAYNQKQMRGRELLGRPNRARKGSTPRLDQGARWEEQHTKVSKREGDAVYGDQ